MDSRTHLYYSPNMEKQSFAALYNYMLQLKPFNRITWDVMDKSRPKKASRPNKPQKQNSWETSPK